MRKPLIAAASTLLVGAGLAFASPASASQSYDPNVARVANPANVCASIPGSVERASSMLGIPVDLSGFDYASCVTTMAHGAAVVEPVEVFGSPYAQCDMLVAVGVFSYPVTLHNGSDMEDQMLPDLTVKNRKECGNALYAYHTIASYLFAEG